MTDKLSLPQVAEVLAKSPFLVELIGRRAMRRLRERVADLCVAPPSKIIEEIDGFEDMIGNVKSDKFLSYSILSDDVEGSECGPWVSAVFGLGGCWVASSVEYEDLWFSSRDSAISVAEDRSHEVVIELIDRGVLRFQRVSEDIQGSKGGGSPRSIPGFPRKAPAKRVLDFFRVDSGEMFRRTRFGIERADIFGFLAVAIRSDKASLSLAVDMAKELGWHEATLALGFALRVQQRFSDLESEVMKLKKMRMAEIEIDDWCREQSIALPEMTDFIRFAAIRKPFCHYREASEAWDSEMPRVYREAFERVSDARRLLAAERFRPEEE